MSLASAHVQKYEIRDGYTEYFIKISYLGKEWPIRKRYSDFVLFDYTFQKNGTQLDFKLPPKTWFKKFDSNVLKSRQKGLQSYLNNLLANSNATEVSLIKEFLEVDHHFLMFSKQQSIVQFSSNDEIIKILEQCKSQFLKIPRQQMYLQLPPVLIRARSLSDIALSQSPTGPVFSSPIRGLGLSTSNNPTNIHSNQNPGSSPNNQQISQPSSVSPISSNFYPMFASPTKTPNLVAKLLTNSTSTQSTINSPSSTIFAATMTTQSINSFSLASEQQIQSPVSVASPASASVAAGTSFRDRFLSFDRSFLQRSFSRSGSFRIPTEMSDEDIVRAAKKEKFRVFVERQWVVSEDSIVESLSQYKARCSGGPRELLSSNNSMHSSSSSSSSSSSRNSLKASSDGSNMSPIRAMCDLVDLDSSVHSIAISSHNYDSHSSRAESPFPSSCDGDSHIMNTSVNTSISPIQSRRDMISMQGDSNDSDDDEFIIRSQALSSSYPHTREPSYALSESQTLSKDNEWHRSRVDSGFSGDITDRPMESDSEYDMSGNIRVDSLSSQNALSSILGPGTPPPKLSFRSPKTPRGKTALKDSPLYSSVFNATSVTASTTTTTVDSPLYSHGTVLESETNNSNNSNNNYYNNNSNRNKEEVNPIATDSQKADNTSDRSNVSNILTKVTTYNVKDDFYTSSLDYTSIMQGSTTSSAILSVISEPVAKSLWTENISIREALDIVIECVASAGVVSSVPLPALNELRHDGFTADNKYVNNCALNVFNNVPFTTGPLLRRMPRAEEMNSTPVSAVPIAELVTITTTKSSLIHDNSNDTFALEVPLELKRHSSEIQFLLDLPTNLKSSQESDTCYSEASPNVKRNTVSNSNSPRDKSLRSPRTSRRGKAQARMPLALIATDVRRDGLEKLVKSVSVNPAS